MEYIEGDAYGLVPSDGKVYCQGSGDVLHHRTECSSLASTPAERLMRYQDRDGMTWWNLKPDQAHAHPVLAGGHQVRVRPQAPPGDGLFVCVRAVRLSLSACDASTTKISRARSSASAT
ncbi:hypothetical protein GCM10027612_70850 [Microbispora bryophytorum subsp. camponoti]